MRRKPGGATRRARASEHLHQGLGAEHPPLIGRQDQRLLAGQQMGLAADVPLAIEEQHPQQQTGGIEQLHGDHAHWALAWCRDAERGQRQGKEAGHGWDGERHHRCAPVMPAPRKGRGAQRSDSRQPWRGARTGAARVV